MWRLRKALHLDTRSRFRYDERAPFSLLRDLPDNPYIIVAHPDDESIGLGVYLQRCATASLLFLTSGESGGSHNQFMSKGMSRYFREDEAKAVNDLLPHVKLVGFERLPDTYLYKYMGDAAKRILESMTGELPHSIVTHAFEGGHPDHDCCSFIGNRLGRKLGIPVWEFPEYTARPPGLIQSFYDGNHHSPVAVIRPTLAEAKLKSQMFGLHNSQKGVLAMFDAGAHELLRVQPDRDYYHPRWLKYFSNPGYLSQDVVEAFRRFDEDFS